MWGFFFLEAATPPELRKHLLHAGYFVAFSFLLCGASRLARFNITANPVPRNPGRPDRKYFVGLPIPASAGMVAAVVYAFDAEPLRWWPAVAAWLVLVALLSFLMVSTWRYRSFKDFSLVRPRSPISVVLLGMMIYLIWNYSQPVLLGLAVVYVASGIVVRLGGILRRKSRGTHRPPETQEQVS